MLSGNCKYVWNDVYCLQRTPPCLSEVCCLLGTSIIHPSEGVFSFVHLWICSFIERLLMNRLECIMKVMNSGFML